MGIKVDSFYTAQLGLGALEGPISTEMKVESFMRRVKHIFGSHTPIYTDGNPEGKKWAAAWDCTGPEKDPDNHGSHLIIISFHNEAPLYSVDELIWKEHAEDFCY